MGGNQGQAFGQSYRGGVGGYGGDERRGGANSRGAGAG